MCNIQRIIKENSEQSKYNEETRRSESLVKMQEIYIYKFLLFQVVFMLLQTL